MGGENNKENTPKKIINLSEKTSNKVMEIHKM